MCNVFWRRIALVSSICASTVAFSFPSFFGDAAPAKTTPPLPTVLSPSDFQGQVQSLGEANKSQLSDQVNQAIAKTAKTPKTPGGATNQAVPPPVADIPPAPLGSPAASPSPQVNAPTTTSTVLSAPSEESSGTELSTSHDKTAGSASHAVTQPYTGFQSGGTPANNPASGNSSAQPQSGGWNIKY